jgi:glycyl-tRNA synthetase alpha chain
MMRCKDMRQIILTLERFWDRQGFALQQPYDAEAGAGTMAPEAFLRVLSPEPYCVAYVMPSRRPTDGRYGDNPNRVQKHHRISLLGCISDLFKA